MKSLLMYLQSPIVGGIYKGKFSYSSAFHITYVEKENPESVRIVYKLIGENIKHEFTTSLDDFNKRYDLQEAST